MSNTEQHPINSAEEWLISEKLARRRTLSRQKILGCLGCQWHKEQDTTADEGIYQAKIAECTGISTSKVNFIIRGLETAGVLTKVPEPIATANANNRPTRIYLFPADSELGDAFWNQLDIPDSCPLDGYTGQLSFRAN